MRVRDIVNYRGWSLTSSWNRKSLKAILSLGSFASLKTFTIDFAATSCSWTFNYSFRVVGSPSDFAVHTSDSTFSSSVVALDFHPSTFPLAITSSSTFHPCLRPSSDSITSSSSTIVAVSIGYTWASNSCFVGPFVVADQIACLDWGLVGIRYWPAAVVSVIADSLIHRWIHLRLFYYWSKVKAYYFAAL